MAKLSRAQFLVKYNGLFADNEIQNITEATFREWALDMLDSFAGQDKGPNDTIGGVKLVIYLTREEAIRAGRPSYAALSDVKSETVVLGNLACVNLFPGAPNTWLVAVYDDGQGPYPVSPGFFGLADGSGQANLVQSPLTAGLLSLKWVLRDSPEAQLANVPLYKKGTAYRENDLVRQLFGTYPNVKSIVFYANESGNDIPAPSKPEGDAYWSVFNPAPPVTYPFQTVTPAELRQLRATAKLSTNRLYVVSPRPILDDPEDRANPDVYVRALMETELEATAWLLIGTNNRQLVNYDLATDTTSPIGLVKLTVDELREMVGSFVPGQQYLISDAPAGPGMSLLDPPGDPGPLMVWAQDKDFLAPFGFIAGGGSGNDDSLVQVYDGPARNLLLLVLPVPGQGIYRGNFQPDRYYLPAQLVSYQGTLYDRIDPGASATFVAADWRLVAGGGGGGGGDTSTTYFLRVASTAPSGAGNVSDTGPNYIDGDGFYKLKKATNLANIEITKSGGAVVFTGPPGTWPTAGVFLNESSTATYTVRLTPSNVALNVELVASAVVA